MIYVVRHGETEWNAERRMQGRRESHLTPRGRRQAAAMAELVEAAVRAEASEPWRLVASPLVRAQETAAIISERTGLGVETDERLAEIAFGEWEGRLRDEVSVEHPELFAGRDWLVSAPGGETYEEVRARVAAWLAEQPPEPGRRVIAVGHGMTNRVIRSVYLGLSRAATLALEAPQDAIFRLKAGAEARLACASLS